MPKGAKAMEIRFLGVHNLESVNTKLTSILVDDILALDAGGLTSSLSFEEQARIRSILLTHGHYDHIRDVPAFALANSDRTIDILGTEATLEILSNRLLDGTIYPKFTEWPSPERPVLKLKKLEPYQARSIGDYSVLPVPVPHSGPTVGYQVSEASDSPAGGLFFTGDTGAGLSECWEYISPELMLVDITFSNEFSDAARERGHLCLSLFGK